MLAAPTQFGSGGDDPQPADDGNGRWRGPLIVLLGLASLVLIGTVAFDAAFGGSEEEGRAIGAPLVTFATTTSEPTTTVPTTTHRALPVTRNTQRQTRPTTRPPRTTTSARPTRRTTARTTSPPATDTVLITPGAHYAEQVGDAVRVLSEQGFDVSVVYVTGDGTQPQNTVVDVSPTGNLPRGTAIVVSAVTPQNGG
jgi:ketosteroid isomerase-like protein